MRQQVIALVDCSNFYVSVEHSFDASLHNRPVIVLSNNDGNLVASSEEAKRLGLVRGLPYFQVRSIIRAHQVAVFSSNFVLYQDVSDRIMHILAPYAEECNRVCQQEIYSIDECFLSLSHVASDRLLDYARIMQARILRATGVPVRIGIGPTKTISKIALEVGKQDSAYNGVVNLADTEDQKLTSILEQIAIEDIWGLNKKSCAKLRSYSITTARDFRDADAAWIRRLLNVTRQRLVYELRGIACIPLEIASKQKKGIMASRSFGSAVGNFEELADALSHFASLAAEKLRRQESTTLSVSVFVSTNFFDKKQPQYAAGTSRRLLMPTNFTPDILATVRDLLKEIFRSGYSYKRGGVYLSEIQPHEVVQMNLFQSYSLESEIKKARIMAVVDIIHSFFGREAIFWGVRGDRREWKTKAQRVSKRYSTQWSELLVVQ